MLNNISFRDDGPVFIGFQYFAIVARVPNYVNTTLGTYISYMSKSKIYTNNSTL